MNLRGVFFIFHTGIGPKADGIAKIIKGTARHDGIQVQNAKGLGTGRIEHDVIEFGIVMGGP